MSDSSISINLNAEEADDVRRAIDTFDVYVDDGELAKEAWKVFSKGTSGASSYGSKETININEELFTMIREMADASKAANVLNKKEIGGIYTTLFRIGEIMEGENKSSQTETKDIRPDPEQLEF